ncbi:tyrosine-protein phosphatase [Motilimonas eburnea]|uniref:tyrosine-protein phosphatase n=1 Tax=Motilimonas eburnea TaxID=1737488 RepID=UPI001E5DFB9F|nr:CpsB/CapC family capsule biosynthesis tyrosine phosphatase [Motilimonas eburnea]MCE2570628.1 capsule biosynthesis protein CapC [Motilimonas eburnea]
MIDLHCHILPGIDDGADQVSTSLHMLAMARDDGITHSVMTPHIEPGRFDNNQQTIAAAASLIRQQDNSYSFSLAAEVRLDPQIMLWAKQEVLPFIGRYRQKNVLLLEFPHAHIPPGSDNLTAWLLKQGILPMIAHPERNRAVWEQPAKLLPFIKQGCLMQVTANSLLGGFGERSLLRAKALLEEGHASVIASDAHNLSNRTPKLSAALAKAEQWLGHDKARALVLDTPAEIVGL